MIVKYVVFCVCILTGVLSGAPESILIQEMRLSIENFSQRLHAQSIEFNLFQERLLSLEKSMDHLKHESKGSLTEKNLERRISHLEKMNETLVTDFKTLKTHFNESRDSLTHCQSQLNKIDKQLTADIQSLKCSLSSMLILLQNPSTEQKTYIVQAGDSLGQIALQHKTDIKTLKKLNDLSSDKIFSGQKLIVP